jgi:hypothetical protein
MNENILKVQEIFRIPETGVVDDLTVSAIKNFQLVNQMPGTGNLDGDTLKLLGLSDDTITTDLFETHKFHLDAPLFSTHLLKKGEYFEEETKKEYIFLHHTAGWNNPYTVIDGWSNDSRGKIGTEFVVGGINFKTGDSTFDGTALKCFPKNNYAYHLGGSPINGKMHKCSVGIEICNFGWVTQRDNKFFTYTGTEIPASQVTRLKSKFRGYEFYHKYTEKQIEKVFNLIKYLSDLHSIDYSIGLPTMIKKFGVKAFEKYDDIVAGKVKGILSHTNVRSDKTDIFPQPEIIEMLLNLSK